MVNRGLHSHPSHGSSSLLASRFRARKLCGSAITFYTFFIFAFSFFLFLFYLRHFVPDEHQHHLPHPHPHPHPHSQSQSRSRSRSPQESSKYQYQEQLWDSPFSHALHSCLKPTAKYKGSQGFDGYLTVRSNGGLNQMRTGISDMVAVAHIMNATLVIPQLDKHVFDEDHFIDSLKRDIRIVKELPKNLEAGPRARKHFTSWSGVGYYEEMKRLWNEYQVIHVAKSDSRLANNDLPLDIQRLRCRAMYQALRFSLPIEDLGKSPMFSVYHTRNMMHVVPGLPYHSLFDAFKRSTWGFLVK
ncbi:hypothetical protein Ahy_A10g048467 isoform C [Arachis hypogaea]|uniref:O-fucosyltransferase family protein n=1 Tax=Arachis hypogaea TaxID=3818 RepID=A0A445B567_ARAHY|nr:hypothetical protein Ahy_A10g048467 isoform C [Arachis hypogaea]